MTTASVLLLVLGLLGAFDVFYFHHHVARVPHLASTRAEAWAHIAKAPVYAAQFLLIPNVELHGRWLALLIVVYVLDIGVAAWDVAIEPRARAASGGLPPGEYAMHIALSVLAGLLIGEVARTAWPWHALPDAVVWHEAVPLPLRATLAVLGAGTLLMGLVELGLILGVPARIRARLGAAPPVHVAIDIDTTVAELWRITQDHVLHPSWDRRFSRITMLSGDAGVTTGTEMVYEKRMLGVTIRGGGRYKLHRPLKQSTFEFWSDDVRSIIRRGVGLWLYRDLGGGRVRFSTSYTYSVRWGWVGEILDRCVFRAWFQRETERSFQRLAHDLLHQAAPVRGANGRKPARCATTAALELA